MSEISYEMTGRVRFFLSFDPLKWDFIVFKMNIISIRKHIADRDAVNDVNVFAPSCYYMSGHMIFMTKLFSLINSDVMIKCFPLRIASNEREDKNKY